MEHLTQTKILRFWGPLTLTWLMMALEGPFLNALVARTTEAEYNLAAFGVAWSLGLVIEAPVICLLTVSTAFTEGRRSYEKLRLFSYTLNVVTTIGMVLLLIPSVFSFVAQGLLRLDSRIAGLTQHALLFFIVWPGSIGYRRFYQGILIRHNKTDRVAKGTVIRLLSMGLTGLTLFLFSGLPGASIGAAALSVGVFMEAIASRIMAAGVVADLKDETLQGKPALTLHAIWTLYYPLTLTIVIAFVVRPLVTFAVGQARLPLESLAALPVVSALVFLFQSVGLGMQEAAVVLAGRGNENAHQLNKFVLRLALTVTGIMGLIAFSDLSLVWFKYISGLPDSLTSLAQSSTKLALIAPALTVWAAYLRGLMVKAKTPHLITFSTIIETLVIGSSLYIAIDLFDLTGVYAGVLALVIGGLASVTFLVTARGSALSSS